MIKRYLAISIPAVSGVVLMLLVQVNLDQYRAGEAPVMGLLSREIPLVLIGLISALVVFICAVSWTFKKQWRDAVLAFFSVLVFAACLTLAGASSGVFYTTAEPSAIQQ